MKFFIYICCFSLIFLGCNKKWKKTAEVNFSVEFITSKTSVSYFNISGGNLNLTKFSLNGARKKGEPVTFSNAIITPVVFDIATQTLTPSLVYDIPQGEYNSIKISFRFDKNTNGKSIIVNGFFKDSSETDSPFIFELEDRIDVDVLASSLSNSSITIVSENSTFPVINFDVVDWFEHIPRSAYEDGETTSVNGTEYLYINKTYNTSLYTLILNRIGETAKITFE